MDELNCKSITITHRGDQSEVQCTVQRLREDQQESISLTVLIASQDSQSITDVRKAALCRAIELLQSSLNHTIPPSEMK